MGTHHSSPSSSSSSSSSSKLLPCCSSSSGSNRLKRSVPFASLVPGDIDDVTAYLFTALPSEFSLDCIPLIAMYHGGQRPAIVRGWNSIYRIASPLDILGDHIHDTDDHLQLVTDGWRSSLSGSSEHNSSDHDVVDDESNDFDSIEAVTTTPMVPSWVNSLPDSTIPITPTLPATCRTDDIWIVKHVNVVNGAVRRFTTIHQQHGGHGHHKVGAPRKSSRWKAMTSSLHLTLPKFNCVLSALVDNGRYWCLISGSEKKPCYRLDMLHMKWYPMTPPYLRRSGPSNDARSGHNNGDSSSHQSYQTAIASYYNRLYLFGHQGHVATSMCSEMYDIRTNKWTFVSDVPDGVTFVAAVGIPHAGIIVCFASSISSPAPSSISASVSSHAAPAPPPPPLFDLSAHDDNPTTASSPKSFDHHISPPPPPPPPPLHVTGHETKRLLSHRDDHETHIHGTWTSTSGHHHNGMVFLYRPDSDTFTRVEWELPCAIRYGQIQLHGLIDGVIIMMDQSHDDATHCWALPLLNNNNHYHHNNSNRFNEYIHVTQHQWKHFRLPPLKEPIVYIGG
jgi:hypothetical protein